jgi:hypothetical protein
MAPGSAPDGSSRVNDSAQCGMNGDGGGRNGGGGGGGTMQPASVSRHNMRIILSDFTNPFRANGGSKPVVGPMGDKWVKVRKLVFPPRRRSMWPC